MKKRKEKKKPSGETERAEKEGGAHTPDSSIGNT